MSDPVRDADSGVGWLGQMMVLFGGGEWIEIARFFDFSRAYLAGVQYLAQIEQSGAGVPHLDGRAVVGVSWGTLGPTINVVAGGGRYVRSVAFLYADDVEFL